MRSGTEPEIVPTLTLVTGGARSGKSAWTLHAASALPGRRVFIATAEARDEEMRLRILKHRGERGSGWGTEESPLEIVDSLSRLRQTHDVLILDCLTLWVSNLIEGNRDVPAAFQQLRAELEQPCSSRVFLVTNEVGWGIVPENALARRFRDLAGHLNQEMAALAQRVVLVVSGIPVVIKDG